MGAALAGVDDRHSVRNRAERIDAGRAGHAGGVCAGQAVGIVDRAARVARPERGIAARLVERYDRPASAHRFAAEVGVPVVVAGDVDRVFNRQNVGADRRVRLAVRAGRLPHGGRLGQRARGQAAHRAAVGRGVIPLAVVGEVDRDFARAPQRRYQRRVDRRLGRCGRLGRRRGRGGRRLRGRGRGRARVGRGRGGVVRIGRRLGGGRRAVQRRARGRARIGRVSRRGRVGGLGRVGRLGGIGRLGRGRRAVDQRAAIVRVQHAVGQRGQRDRLLQRADRLIAGHSGNLRGVVHKVAPVGADVQHGVARGGDGEIELLLRVLQLRVREIADQADAEQRKHQRQRQRGDEQLDGGAPADGLLQPEQRQPDRPAHDEQQYCDDLIDDMALRRPVAARRGRRKTGAPGRADHIVAAALEEHCRIHDALPHKADELCAHSGA